jgi:septal ring factor EnvC (AmiA/AmiB activator)
LSARLTTARWVAACAGVALAASAAGQGVRDERAELRQRLARQRAELELLKSQKVSILDVVERAQRISRAQVARAEAVGQEMRAMRRRVELLERQEAAAKRALDYQAARLTPRLRAMYRLGRQRALDVLLSAEDFSALVWRSRAMARLVQEDLELLARVQRAAHFQEIASRQLELLRGALGLRLEAAKREAERAAQQRADFSELLDLISAEQSHGARVVQELEAAERELTALIEDMEAPPAASGFGALKGRLPLPTAGRIEVGYGKVVNPRFSTVTVQKGLDIRAPLGTPVHAVAAGQVAWAGWMRGYGNLLIVDHGDSYHTVMAHLGSLAVNVGEPVEAGQQVGEVGDTGSLKGAYLYFEIRQKGIAADPAVWLGDTAR